MTDGTTTWTYTYDANGMRTLRSNGTTAYNYVYNGSQLTQMTVGTNTLNFAYDASGIPMVVNYNGTNYYYLVNLQGDIVAIANSSGTLVVNYTYDAWGNRLSVTGSMSSTLGTLNPLRYRGYVYDQETNLYYLQSRYYDPEIGRFINADAFASTGGLLGNNLFAYCWNNPVNLVDYHGYIPKLPPSSYELSPSSSLPYHGEPHSADTLFNPDGTPKQKRWYDENGNPERDRDYNHNGDMDFPHDHTWENGERSKEHLDPSPDYKFSGDVLMGVGVIFINCIGIVYVVANDITGIGAADDALVIPLVMAVCEGFGMIFK